MSTEEATKNPPPMTEAELKKFGEVQHLTSLSLEELEEYIANYRNQIQTYTILETRYLVGGDDVSAARYRENYEKGRKTLASLIQYQTWRIENTEPKFGFKIGDLFIVTKIGKTKGGSQHGAALGAVYRVVAETGRAKNTIVGEQKDNSGNHRFWFYEHEVAPFSYQKGDGVKIINWQKNVASAYKNDDVATLVEKRQIKFKEFGAIWETKNGSGYNIAESEFTLFERDGMTAKEFAESLLEKESA